MSDDAIRLKALVDEIDSLSKAAGHSDLCRMCRQFIDEDIKRKKSEVDRIVEECGGVLL